MVQIELSTYKQVGTEDKLHRPAAWLLSLANLNVFFRFASDFISTSFKLLYKYQDWVSLYEPVNL